MDRKLLVQGIAKFLIGVVLLGALLFIPAGTLAWPQGWRLMAILFVPMLIVGVIMILKNPELLRKRLNAKEKQEEQKDVLKYSSLMFLTAFILAGLNFRFRWIVLPDWISWVAVAIFLISYGLYAEVMKENAYLSRTVEVQEGQQVVDTGLYGIVRHPMYMSTLFLFLAMPLVLGSLISFLIMLLYIPIIARRIRNEEQVLEEGLQGYAEYKQKVKYKVIPFIW
ncbi:MAG: isoprenylcysteine carboxylmethyltransferase family protein [Clostridiales bacterium]|nr:isoprenylcysteine carboxylmethyltransferase family protein [Clostridiales bacterium]